MIVLSMNYFEGDAFRGYILDYQKKYFQKL